VLDVLINVEINASNVEICLRKQRGKNQTAFVIASSVSAAMSTGK